MMWKIAGVRGSRASGSRDRERGDGIQRHEKSFAVCTVDATDVDVLSGNGLWLSRDLDGFARHPRLHNDFALRPCVRRVLNIWRPRRWTSCAERSTVVSTRRGRCTSMDDTGGSLYAESQLREHAAALSAGVFGNPHSAARARAPRPTSSTCSSP